MIHFSRVKTVAAMALLCTGLTASAQPTPATGSIPASPAAQSSTMVDGKKNYARLQRTLYSWKAGPRRIDPYW